MRVVMFLQGVGKELVHLGDAGRDGKVDGTVANLDDDSANNVGVDGVGDLELLALADVGRLGDGRLEAAEGLVVQGLGRGDGHLNLAAGRRHDLVELLADAAEEAEAVVLGEDLEETLDGGGVAASLLDELGDDGGLVLGAQGRGGEDGGKLNILLDDGAEGGEGLGRGFEGRRLGRGSVLIIDAVSKKNESRQRRAPGSQLNGNLVRGYSQRRPGGRQIFVSTYESAGVGAVDTKDGDGGLALVGGSGGEGSHGNGAESEGALRSSGSDGVEGLASEHGETWGGGIEMDVEVLKVGFSWLRFSRSAISDVVALRCPGIKILPLHKPTVVICFTAPERGVTNSYQAGTKCLKYRRWY